jgi:periplasmic mercuric ion binding protein
MIISSYNLINYQIIKLLQTLKLKKMKTLKLVLAIVLLGTFGMTISAQTTTAKTTSQQKTETFKVWGKCDMCKARIEKAVKAEGATSANWDTKTLMLAVTFDPAKTSVEMLSKKLASVGHDTEKFKATDEAYSKLPGCCHYERVK